MSAIFKTVKHSTKEMLTNSNGSHDWEHTLRVLKLAIHIARVENVDMEIVKIAALLHDVGRKYEDESKGKICHAKKSAEIAWKLLEKEGLETNKIEKIIHCIETHRFRGNKKPQ